LRSTISDWEDIPLRKKFEIAQPSFKWADHPGTIRVIQDYPDDTLFGITNPSLSQRDAIKKFADLHSSEQVSLYYGYNVEFCCGLEEDLQTEKEDYKNLYEVEFFLNVRTFQGVAFKLAFSDWFE
jgi:hypothetical protein